MKQTTHTETKFKQILKTTVICAFFVWIFLMNPHRAYSDFSFSGGNEIAGWLVDNGYYDNFNEARNFARTGYEGFDDDFAIPHYWHLSLPIQFEIVGEFASFADKNTLGYFNDGGLTEIFNGIQSGPTTLSIDGLFGLYMTTPQNNTWFTDRAFNVADQDGPFSWIGGKPQSLIYELTPGREWLIAWEDLDVTMTGSDRDFNDMFVRMVVAPEPVSSVLFLLGGGAFTMAARRKKRMT